jgi:hypothetical protein
MKISLLEMLICMFFPGCENVETNMITAYSQASTFTPEIKGRMQTIFAFFLLELLARLRSPHASRHNGNRVRFALCIAFASIWRLLLPRTKRHSLTRIADAGRARYPYLDTDPSIEGPHRQGVRGPFVALLA